VPFTGQYSAAKVFVKPSFSFPFIKPPNMIPCVDQQMVSSSFKLKKSGVVLKPEAPWIKKCQFGIKFTDEIYYTDDDRDPTPEDEKEYKKKKQRQQERAMEGAGFVTSHSEKVELRTNIFADDADEQADPQNPDGAKAASPPLDEDHFLFQDEDGNPVNIADIEALKGDPQAVEMALQEQMKILQDMQKQQAKLAQQEEDYNQGSNNDFNKLQNISNLKDIAK